MRLRSSFPGFTLLEMLTVIAIIMVLVGLLFPATRLLRQAARRRLAATQARCIAQAAMEYRAVYQRWPGQNQGAVDTVATNYGTFLGDLTNNPRGSTFLRDLEDLVSGDCLLDPWNRPYGVALDENGDGMLDINIGGFGSPVVTNVRESVGVFSWGPDTAIPSLRVYSWKP